MSATARRPAPEEYPAYFAPYVAAVPDGDVLGTLEAQIDAVRACVESFGDEGSLRRYADGKWSVREILGHLSDTERVFVCRGLSFARGDTTELPGMDENAWVAGADFDGIPAAALLDEFEHVRRATIALYRTLGEPALDRGGVANGIAVTVRAIPWLIAGHVAHHLGVLEERYR